MNLSCVGTNTGTLRFSGVDNYSTWWVHAVNMTTFHKIWTSTLFDLSSFSDSGDWACCAAKHSKRPGPQIGPRCMWFDHVKISGHLSSQISFQNGSGEITCSSLERNPSSVWYDNGFIMAISQTSARHATVPGIPKITRLLSSICQVLMVTASPKQTQMVELTRLFHVVASQEHGKLFHCSLPITFRIRKQVDVATTLPKY